MIERSTPARALAVFAHPDDPEVSCGGTLARWAELGAEVHLVIANRGDKGSFDPNTDPDALAAHRTGWANQDFDRLLGEAARTTAPAERFALLARAEALLLEEAPVLPIHFYTRVRLVRPELKGWSPNLLDDHPYKYLYLEAARN